MSARCSLPAARRRYAWPSPDQHHPEIRDGTGPLTHGDLRRRSPLCRPRRADLPRKAVSPCSAPAPSPSAAPLISSARPRSSACAPVSLCAGQLVRRSAPAPLGPWRRSALAPCSALRRSAYFLTSPGFSPGAAWSSSLRTLSAFDLPTPYLSAFGALLLRLAFSALDISVGASVGRATAARSRVGGRRAEIVRAGD
jgi:hypothetical protein